MNTPDGKPINGIACDALRRLTREVAEDPSKGKVRLEVTTTWAGGVRSDSQVKSLEVAGERLPRPFAVRMDEPFEFLGANTGPNPQEMLLAAFNACLLAGYVAGCSLAGIELESLTIQTEGELDLRGWLGLDTSIRPGYSQLRYRVNIRGNGTPEQFQRVHEAVLATSPNRWNVANAVQLKAELVVERPDTGLITSET